METADANDSTLILANDPDADRLAVACKDRDGKWVILTGNEIAAVFADWVWLQWKSKNPHGDPSKCAMIASTVSSKHLQAMAKREGFQFFDTLTGFKWIGNKAIEVTNDGMEFLFGYEVEIGFLVGSTSFDKDGIRTAAIFAEAANYWLRTTGESVLDRVNEFYKKYGYFKMTNSYFIYNDMSIGDQIFHHICTGYNGTYPTHCGEFVVKSIRNISTNYDSSYPDMKSRLPLVTDAHMITFTFTNGVTVTLRNSGTEPKLKYYIEANSDQSPEEAHQLMEKVTQSVIEEFIRPTHYGLVARKLD
uniref:Glucose 1,6-bisphosphate synthase n=1 Tax=Lygus hesperus TaxID=30085 RepID=A0A0A9XRK6_LYGHE